MLKYKQKHLLCVDHPSLTADTLSVFVDSVCKVLSVSVCNLFFLVHVSSILVTLSYVLGF